MGCGGSADFTAEEDSGGLGGDGCDALAAELDRGSAGGFGDCGSDDAAGFARGGSADSADGVGRPAGSGAGFGDGCSEVCLAAGEACDRLAPEVGDSAAGSGVSGGFADGLAGAVSEAAGFGFELVEAGSGDLAAGCAAGDLGDRASDAGAAAVSAEAEAAGTGRVSCLPCSKSATGQLAAARGTSPGALLFSSAGLSSSPGCGTCPPRRLAGGAPH